MLQVGEIEAKSVTSVTLDHTVSNGVSDLGREALGEHLVLCSHFINEEAGARSSLF